MKGELKKAKTLRKNLADLIKQFDLYDYEFADLIGANRSVLHTTIRGKCIPTLRLVYRINEVFPTLSIHWLVTGEGKQWIGKEPKYVSGAAKRVAQVAQR